MTRKDLEALDREALIERASDTGVARPEVLTRDELISAIEDLEGTEDQPSSERGPQKGFLGRMRGVLAAFVERGLNLPQAAERIRAGGTVEDPMPLATMTLAEIYLAQGYQDRSLTVLTEVLRREPGHQAALELQRRIRTGQIPIPGPPLDEEGDEPWAPPPEPPPTAPPVYRGPSATLSGLSASALSALEIPTPAPPATATADHAEPAEESAEFAIDPALAEPASEPAAAAPAIEEPAIDEPTAIAAEPVAPAIEEPTAVAAPAIEEPAAVAAPAVVAASAVEQPAVVAVEPAVEQTIVETAPLEGVLAVVAPAAEDAAEGVESSPPVPALMLDEEPLPASYGVDEVVLMPVDPTTAYVYFEIQPETLADLSLSQPGGTLELRVASPQGAVGVRSWPLPGASGDLFLRELPAGVFLGAELGWALDREWTPITRSAIVRLARDEATGPVASRVVEWTGVALPVVVAPPPALALGIELAQLHTEQPPAEPRAEDMPATTVTPEASVEPSPTVWWMTQTTAQETQIQPREEAPAAPPIEAAPIEAPRTQPPRRASRWSRGGVGSSGLWFEEGSTPDDLDFFGPHDRPAGHRSRGSSELSR
jgi:hypothetical protein